MQRKLSILLRRAVFRVFKMAIILRLQDLLDKKSKNEELKRYKADLASLQEKLERLQRYISLTETIIRMIEQEEIVEFREQN